MFRPERTSCDTHGGRVRELAASLGRSPEELLDFSANVNFLGPTPSVVAAARRAVEEMGWYPQDPPAPVRRAAATYLRVPEDRVLMGNGASELISLVVAYLRPRTVLVVGPTFTEYARTARAWGAEVDLLEAPEDAGFALTPELLRDSDARERIRQADLVCICDPNNPTGTLMDRQVRAELLAAAEQGRTWVLADESFLGFTLAWPEGSAAFLEGDRLIIIHSLTKILTLPGLRVGAAVVPETVAEPLRRRLPPWNLNCVAQGAASAALAEKEMLARTPRETEMRRRELTEGLRALPGVDAVLPGEANFLCVRLAGTDSGRVTELLREKHGVLIRDLSRFPGMGSRYIRVAVRDTADNQKLLSALARTGSEAGPASEGRIS